MDIVASQKQISNEEKAQVDQQVQTELIEHLYQGCLAGTISGIPVGIAIFVDFYKFTANSLLIPWTIFYSLCLVNLTSIYFIYKTHKKNYAPRSWLILYSVAMCLCALSWGICVWLIPDDPTRQYFAFIAFFLIATGYATGTIGQFRLCLATIAIIIIPLIVWCFMKGTFFYNLFGSFLIIYIFFMSSINLRSTQWFKDSLKLKLENTLVSYQANHDLLTGLPNQRLLPQFIESAIQFVTNSQNTFALVCFSLNRMEIINDSLGHEAGDLLIQSVANRLNALAAVPVESGMRYIITISRKDTFNVILVPLKNEEVDTYVKTLFSILDEPFYLEKKGIKLTASLGVSLFKKDGDDYESLLINADAAMLKAKQYGGNRLEYFRPEFHTQTPKQLELETDLYTAVKEKQFIANYQPLVDLRTGRIAGMEALIRWRHPERGLIPPGQFIPLAEETGLIVPIGEWILEEAIKQTLIWHQMGFNALRVAVNLAEKQLREKNIIETINRILKTTHFDPRFLELEITETAILDEAIIHVIKEFKKSGLALAVDDFGTGYSGLSYLKRFDIDKLKIDQSFIRDIPGNNDSIAIVSAIIAVAKELNINTLAEGVETKEQLDFLHGKGCDYIQGYYYSKPLDAENFTQLLIKHQGLAVPASMEIKT